MGSRAKVRAFKDVICLPDQTLYALHLLADGIVGAGDFQIISQALNRAQWLPQFMNKLSNERWINRCRTASI